MGSLARLGLLFALFSGAALLVLEPVLGLDFVSDDVPYIEQNPYVRSLSSRNLTAILDPLGEPARNTSNWAPVHLLAHALEWAVWGPEVLGYHLVNLFLHALVSTLLVALLARRGLPWPAAALGGALFLLHPANVESVAWISQLKTLLALALAVGALLAHPRRPGLGIACFGLALLTKVQALFALPVAAVWAWTPGPGAALARRRWRWLLAWAALALLCAVPQLAVFQRTSEIQQPLHDDPLVVARTVVAIGCRYLVMAVSGLGASPFHEPPPAVSWLDPWWLGGLALGAGLAWRGVATLRGRREEAAWWVWAAAAYLPVSQIFRFLYPMADRYLTFILPGLIGGVAFAVRAAWPRLEASRIGHPPRAARFAAVAGVLLALHLGLRSHAQARVWRSPVTIGLASAANYPEGLAAHRMRARQAALRGDAATAARELAGALALGFDRFMDVQADPAFAAVLGAPELDAVLREIAADWIATSRGRSQPTYLDLYWRAEAHRVRGELDEAEAAFRQALGLGGGFDQRILAELAALREERARRAVGRPAGAPR